MVNSMLEEAVNQSDLDQIESIYQSLVSNYLYLSLLFWRQGNDPKSYLAKLCETAHNLEAIMDQFSEIENAQKLNQSELVVYAFYLLGLPHPAINLDTQDDHTLASAFFGNVLIGAADIADWPKYDRLPKTKRYQLANETDALYAGLLAGHITPKEGVPLAEELWARREDDDYFQSGGEGGGDENHQIVDYRLGAILKKIGSTVPTVHAWRW